MAENSQVVITFIQTGGTIDKDYPKSINGYAFEISEPAIERVIKSLPITWGFTYNTICCCRKDSQEITLEDREKLYNIIFESRSNLFIVTHGTDTMIETAQYIMNRNLKEDVEGGRKCIVFTGAMKPERFKDSEAAVNIGMAISSVQLLANDNTNIDANFSPPLLNAWICMNGRTIHAHECTRDKNTGQFMNKKELLISNK